MTKSIFKKKGGIRGLKETPYQFTYVDILARTSVRSSVRPTHRRKNQCKSIFNKFYILASQQILYKACIRRSARQAFALQATEETEIVFNFNKSAQQTKGRAWAF